MKAAMAELRRVRKEADEDIRRWRCVAARAFERMQGFPGLAADLSSEEVEWSRFKIMEAEHRKNQASQVASQRFGGTTEDVAALLRAYARLYPQFEPDQWLRWFETGYLRGLQEEGGDDSSDEEDGW